MKKPLISVIIPAFNEEKYLTTCLKSLTSQKTKIPYEIILVDNNSTDQTSNIAKKFKAKVIFEKHQGRAFARQAGVDNAKGEILAFTEADCILPANWIEIISKYYKLHPNIVGFSGSYNFINTTWFLSLIGPLILNITSPLYKLFYGNHIFRGTNFTIRKSIIKKIRGFDNTTVPYDDVDLGRRAGNYGPIHFLPWLKVTTSDRRFRGRLLKFFWEFLTSYPKVFWFGKRGSDDLYAVIR